MNIGRAKEISESGQTWNVRYEGKQVQIQHVDEKSGTVRIYKTENPNQEYDVPASSLLEE